MLCLRPDELKRGMKIARPIYNKQGVLLYDRNTKLTKQSVQSIKNFGLFGVFILEPTEPVPDITDEEREFERFQTMSMFALKDEMDALVQHNTTKNVNDLADKIIRMYGRLTHKLTMTGSLRSNDDFVYKHSISVAILCAVIAANMGMSVNDTRDLVVAALLHEMGRVLIPKTLLGKEGELTEEDHVALNRFNVRGNELVQLDPKISSASKVIAGQNFREMTGNTGQEIKLLESTKILRIADVFDTMTQLGMGNETHSQIAVVKYFLSEMDFYGEAIVAALIRGINILNPGVCVELTTGTRALVIKENENNILRPILLGLDDNTIYDLSNDRLYKIMQIKDILKTMDKRVALSEDFLEQFNISQLEMLQV